ncbi:unnamed protein product [Parnassius apollo]|uniref:(apollo) hypothetical protein n=1 Tax=Parnassius apollo TaxID=110799 RepID=A0A8S3W6W0_PARAO|nr:unnamed protein product [Parnassius apollo]
MITEKRLRQGVTPFLYEIADCSLVQTQVNKENQPLDLSDTVQGDEDLNILIKSNEKYATSAVSKRTWETMLDVPSCSYESWPLRDATKEYIYIFLLCKKPRYLLRDILETERENMNIDDIITSEIITDKSTSPIQIYCTDKSVQARIKSSREEELMIRNKSLVQKVFQLNKTVNNLKSLIKIVKSYTENSEIENIISGNFANICKELKKNHKV